MEASQLSQQMFLVYMLCKQRNEEDLGIFIPGLSFFGFMHHWAAFIGSAFKAVSRFLGSEEVSTCEVPNDRIFHCLNMPQNSPNLEYTSHLLKNVIIYCRPQFPGLGAIIKKSAFWLLTPIYFVAHSKTLYPHIRWIVLNLEMQAPPSFCFFFPTNSRNVLLTFSNSSQVISSICTKLCTQHLWTLLTKSY